MKHAIITGSTGLVGTSVARYLYSKGTEVLCLGRKDLQPIEINSHFGFKCTYLSLSMEDISELKEKLEAIEWTPSKSCVFYNFAWSGVNSLTDGDLEDQLKNSIYATNAVQTAKEIGCHKFVNAGSLEETYAEEFLSDNTRQYNFGQSNYAVSKLASRNMCKMVAYLEKIDYIHTRMSVPLCPSLSKGTYIASTLKKILNGESYEAPMNPQLFDIITTDEVANAYYLIGKKGMNKADYFIGTSRPDTLGGYFKKFKEYLQGNLSIEYNVQSKESNSIFDNSELSNDTGFSVYKDFLESTSTLPKK